jgi:hypothetical protein
VDSNFLSFEKNNVSFQCCGFIGFNADPDPAFLVIADPAPGGIQGFDVQKLGKNSAGKKKYFFNKKLQFTYP